MKKLLLTLAQGYYQLYQKDETGVGLGVFHHSFRAPKIWLKSCGKMSASLKLIPIVTCLLVPSYVHADSYDDISREITQGAIRLKTRKIAVLPFFYIGNEHSNGSMTVPEETFKGLAFHPYGDTLSGPSASTGGFTSFYSFVEIWICSFTPPFTA